MNLIFEEVENVMNGPKIIIDSLSTVFDSRMLNFTTMTSLSQTTWLLETIERNTNHTKLDSMMLFNTNSAGDKFQVLWSNPPEIVSYRRFVSNGTVTICASLDTQTLECGRQEKNVQWESNENIARNLTDQAREMHRNSFVEPLLVSCAGNESHENCGVFLAYTFPFSLSENDESRYYGAVGCAFDSSSIAKVIREKSRGKGEAFIVDTKTGFMITSTREDDQIFQAHIKDHPNNAVSVISKKIYASNDDDLSTIELSKQFETAHSGYVVNYRRYESDGVDWLIVMYRRQLVVYQDLLLVFGLFVSVIVCVVLFLLSLCCVIVRCVVVPLREIVVQMEKVNSLNFGTFVRKYSWILEIISVQSSLYYFLDKIEEYKSFLPHFFKLNEAFPDDSVDSLWASTTNNGSEASSSSAGSGTISQGSKSPSTSLITFVSFVRQFSPNIRERFASIVTILVDVFEKNESLSVENISLHQKVCEIIFGNLMQGGMVIHFSHKIFVIGFNLLGDVVFHTDSAFTYARRIEIHCRQIGVVVHVSVVTGKVKVGILGHGIHKVQQTFGETVDLGLTLAKHSKDIQTSPLLDENAINHLQSDLLSEKYSFFICDLCYFREIGLPKEVYCAKPIEETADCELKDTCLLWDLMKQNRLDDCMLVLRRFEETTRILQIEKCVKYMMKKKITYKSFIEESTERKMHMFGSTNSLFDRIDI